jgi:hypothetical protein
VNDELIAINQFRINNDLEDLLKKLSYPTKSKLLISRGGLLRETNYQFQPTLRFSIQLALPENKDNVQINRWLGSGNGIKP